ncbi:hypothetical protein FAEPRAM212_00318 [Faecalibacterium prausnitzii M21/2]|uniref:Uncharacterized protein n=1 Tax=Faecalibacterium prausnitzii M21/2 TaxID=411485 RepID=A8S6U4_9FIRM|nr:hypothetical protein FAEPRAM212_00318 [Faecalibacterium prausnitzii M21/2]
MCSVPRKGHIFSRMFTKDNIFCEVLSRDFSTYFVKNDITVFDETIFVSSMTLYQQAVQTYIHLLILRCKTLVGECPKPL